MNRHMVAEAGTQFFEMASSLGRIHAETLTTMADATARTPFGPVFAMNASLARMAHEGMETMGTRFAAPDAPVTAKAPKKAAKPEPVRRKPKPAKAKTPAPFTVETAPATALADTLEPDVTDVMIEDVLAEIETTALPTIAPALTTDDLSLITGIGATTAKKLNGAGVESFQQIAAMTEAQFAALLESLDIKSIRFSPALWIAEAKRLSA